MKNRTARASAATSALALLLALGACGQESADPGAGTDAGSPTTTAPAPAPAPAPEDDDVTSEPPLPDPARPDVALPTGPVDEEIVGRADVQAAVQAEADRHRVEPDAVRVAGFADVTWSDGSIGCPEPDQMYTMALVPGHQLVLEVDGEMASYHAAQGQDFFYCAAPIAPVPPGPGVPGSDM